MTHIVTARLSQFWKSISSFWVPPMVLFLIRKTKIHHKLLLHNVDHMLHFKSALDFYTYGPQSKWLWVREKLDKLYESEKMGNLLDHNAGILYSPPFKKKQHRLHQQKPLLFQPDLGRKEVLRGNGLLHSWAIASRPLFGACVWAADILLFNVRHNPEKLFWFTSISGHLIRRSFPSTL